MCEYYVCIKGVYVSGFSQIQPDANCDTSFSARPYLWILFYIKKGKRDAMMGFRRFRGCFKNCWLFFFFNWVDEWDDLFVESGDLCDGRFHYRNLIFSYYIWMENLMQNSYEQKISNYSKLAHQTSTETEHVACLIRHRN